MRITKTSIGKSLGNPTRASARDISAFGKARAPPRGEAVAHLYTSENWFWMDTGRGQPILSASKQNWHTP